MMKWRILNCETGQEKHERK